MRLRHISKHVTDQNWLAVFLDFFIVVSGVFIGIQLGNWNESRQIAAAQLEAETRFVSETQANMEALDNFLAFIDTRMTVTRQAISALRSCQTGADAVSQVSQGVNAIRGTPGLQIRKSSLEALTGNDNFLSLMDPDKREMLKEFARNLEYNQRTLDWLEDRPFEKHIEDQAYLTFGDLVDLPGADGVQIRPVQLDAPLDQICRDKAFLGSFYLWERSATFQAYRARQLRDRLQTNLEMFGDP